MTLDANYKVPEGFLPFLDYRHGDENGIPVVGMALLDMGGLDHKLLFNIENGAPVLPLKLSGKIWHVGWDIPTQYAIDTNLQCWKADALGDVLEKVTSRELIRTAEDNMEDLIANRIMTVLGMEIPMPHWAKTALAHGWTAPPGWNNK